MSKREKNLSLQQVKKQNNQKYKELKRITFEQSKIDLDVTFRPSKVNALTADFMGIMQEALTHSKLFDAGAALSVGTALIIKHFTSIETDADDYDGLLDMLRQLKDGNYLDPIMDSFQFEEVEKIFETLKNAVSLVTDEVKKVHLDETAEKTIEDGDR
ncbi:hypothetical protein [Paenibacillus lutrae]|uniref:Uncharacterized protein n=1 Tax=Paenibacillus lutrae TaxID=2078573 RepID=A0A7X3K029_9BACL|nr:hypothetical protein [Paenibacillus lutrae]MVP00804.1 hypothetical protein [Paenibacillus lutrae]